jgi:hypothetical protein
LNNFDGFTGLTWSRFRWPSVPGKALMRGIPLSEGRLGYTVVSRSLGLARMKCGRDAISYKLADQPALALLLGLTAKARTINVKPLLAHSSSPLYFVIRCITWANSICCCL